ATLLEWQSTLNELRRTAIANAELSGEHERRASGERVAEVSFARPSHASRNNFERSHLILALVFLVLLLAPIGFMIAVEHELVAICSAAGGAECLSIDPLVLQLAMIGGPLLAVLVFVLGHAHIVMRRARDLGEDLPFWQAAFGSFGRR